jgi:hypothetical protein
MAGSIRVVEDTEVGDAVIEGVAAPPPTATAPDVSRETQQIVVALHALNGRLQAVENAIQGVPKAVGLIRNLIRALGSRALMCLAMLGCLGLAGFTIWQPTWQGMAITGMVIVGVFAPMAYLASRGN